MKEQLISFETAKLAKEKGFNVNSTSSCWVRLLNGEIIHNNEREDILEHERGEYYLSQPTQSLLQKWLRETHKIIVDVYQESQDHQYTGYWKVDISEFGNYKEDELPDPPITSLSFENALESGLLEGLKLIDNE